MTGCEECGNDEATVTLDDGREVCLDCAEDDADEQMIAWLRELLAPPGMGSP